jgi:hypothetical protein
MRPKSLKIAIRKAMNAKDSPKSESCVEMPALHFILQHYCHQQLTAGAGNRVQTDDLLIRNSQLPCSGLFRIVLLCTHESASELDQIPLSGKLYGTEQGRQEQKKRLQFDPVK